MAIKKQPLSDFDKQLIKELVPEIARLVIDEYKAMLADRIINEKLRKRL